MFKRLKNSEAPFWRVLGTLLDLIIYNVLFVLFCIPIFTIGASCTALYKTIRNNTENKDSSVAFFINSFRNHFKQATIVWVPAFLFFVMAVTDVMFMSNVAIPGGSFIRVVLIAVSVLLVAILSYAFPVIAFNDFTIKEVIKYSFFLSIHNVLFTIPLVILNLFPILFPVLLPDAFAYLLTIWVSILFSAIAFCDSMIITRVLKSFNN